jgi:5-methylcytosine-specific restriction endonuclease McrA
MPKIIKTQRQEHQYQKIHDDFYDSPAWRRLTRRKKEEQPFCEYCLPEFIVDGYVTDHQLPRRLFPELALTYANLKRACKTCDGKKRQIESKCHDRATAIVLLGEGGFYP